MLKIPNKKQLEILLKYYQSKDYSQTQKLASALTQDFPHHKLSWQILSTSLKKIGKISESLVASQKIVDLDTQDALAHYNLGNTLRELKKFLEAEESYKRALSLKPNFAEANYNLGIVKKNIGNLNEAKSYFKKTILSKPNFAEAYNNLGTILENLGELKEAEENYIKAISLKPNFAEAYNNLGVILEQYGNLHQAQVNYEKAIFINPNLTNAHRQLSLIKKFESYDEQFSILQKLYHSKDISDEQLCHTNFSLAKIHDDLENYKKAFEHFSQGNAIKKKILNYNIRKDVKLFEKIKLCFLEIRKNKLKIKKNKNNITPIFIVGMPRSGTTLVEQIISSHSKITGLGELPFVFQFGLSITKGLSKYDPNTLLKFREVYLEKLMSLSKDNLIITDKMPQNFYYIGLISTIFPEAKIIYVKRNPAAVCWANYRQWFRSENLGYSYSIDDIIKYFKLHEDLMIFWKKLLTNKVYEIDYEALTLNHNDEIKKLINHLNINWEEKCLFPEKNKRNVSTASNIQIRKKIYKGSSQKWKKYKPFLNGALDCLDEPLKNTKN